MLRITVAIEGCIIRPRSTAAITLSSVRTSSRVFFPLVLHSRPQRLDLFAGKQFIAVLLGRQFVRWNLDARAGLCAVWQQVVFEHHVDHLKPVRSLNQSRAQERAPVPSRLILARRPAHERDVEPEQQRLLYVKALAAISCSNPILAS